MTEELLSVEDVSRRIGVHAQTVRGWIKDGDLRALRFGGRTGYKIEPSDLQAFLESRKGDAKKAAA